MNRRTVIGWMGSLTLLTASNNFAQVVDLNDAINKAGRQRMLSQRVAKAYLAAGQGVVTQRADEVLAASMALFERQLQELKAFAPTPEVKATYSELETLWSAYKAMLIGQAPVRENATALIDLDGRVLALANKGTLQLEQVSGKPLGRLVNIAGRQRMLSQRLAKFYLAMAWKAPLPNAQAELDKAGAEFVSALDVLANAPEATSAIKQEIDIRDPYHPREVGYFIPAITAATDKRCIPIEGGERCKVAIQTNNVETDDRGYIYIVDRANTGLHILELTGAARAAAGLAKNG